MHDAQDVKKHKTAIGLIGHYSLLAMLYIYRVKMTEH